jgi:transcriptional regulator with XRE-family HTH domain
LNRESQTFASHLRAERERRGISLESIAEKTKIKKSFLESLERGDCSKWPAGTVFRRAYVRDYAAAIGLAPESVVVDFIRLFPVGDESRPVGRNVGDRKPDVAAPQEAPSPLVLTLDLDRRSTWQARLVGPRGRTAAIDTSGVLVLGGILAFLTGSSVWTACGAVAFVYYPATAVLWGRSLASHYLEGRRTRRQVIAIGGPARRVAETAAPSAPELAATPVRTVISRLDAVVDPLLLTAANRSHSPQVPQETTTH